MTEPRFLLDSNLCIYVLADATGRTAQRVGRAIEGSVVTSVVAYAEVMRGIESSDDNALTSARRFFEVVQPLGFDLRAAEIYAALPFRRAKFDRLIAAHSLALGLTLVTNNEADFSDVVGLKVENWTI